MSNTGPEKGKPLPSHAKRSALIFRNTFSLASSAMIAQVLALATMPLLLNKVSAAEFGIYTMGAAFVGYFSLLSLPARQATVKYIAEYGENNTEKIREFASSSILVNFGVGVLMALILATLAHYSQELFSLDNDLSERAKLILYAYALATPISLPLYVYGSILLGLQDYRPISVLDVVGALARAATILLIFFLDGTILWLVFQELFFEIGRNIFQGVLLSRRYDISGFSRNLVRLDHLKKIRSYGGWSLTYVLSTLLIYQGTRILVGIFVSVAAIAYFQIAYMLYNIVNRFSGFLQSAVLPASSSAIVDGDHEFTQKLLIRGTRSSLCVLLPLTLCTVVLAEPILNSWISLEYGREAAFLSQILVSTWFFQGWVMTATTIYRGQGDIREMSILVLVGALCQIALAIVLMQTYGVVGAAVSTVIYYLIITPLQIRIASVKVGFDITRFLSEAVLPVYGLTVIMALLFFSAVNYLGAPSNAWEVIILYITVFFLMTFVLFALAAREDGRMILEKLLLVGKSLFNRKSSSG